MNHGALLPQNPYGANVGGAVADPAPRSNAPLGAQESMGWDGGGGELPPRSPG